MGWGKSGSLRGLGTLLLGLECLDLPTQAQGSVLSLMSIFVSQIQRLNLHTLLAGSRAFLPKRNCSTPHLFVKFYTFG